MIELLFTACLSAAPQECEERSMVFVDVSPMQCMIGAQPELAKWQSTHPLFQVTEWKCQSFRQNGVTL